jgi:phosphate/sulfate permease
MRTGVKIVASWIACVIVSAVLANLIVWLLDDTARKKYEMSVHNAMQANDRVTACAMRIHMLEQRIDMHELRLEEMERMVFGTNFNTGDEND